MLLPTADKRTKGEDRTDRHKRNHVPRACLTLCDVAAAASGVDNQDRGKGTQAGRQGEREMAYIFIFNFSFHFVSVRCRFRFV